jgi:hypothetical protein
VRFPVLIGVVNPADERTMRHTHMALEQELGYFQEQKQEFLRTYNGKFVLIKGDQFLGAFDTPADAYAAGVAQFGGEAFLVKKVAEQEETFRNQALALGLIHARL